MTSLGAWLGYVWLETWQIEVRAKQGMTWGLVRFMGGVFMTIRGAECLFRLLCPCDSLCP
jgi:hypothetical protein